MKIAFDVKGTLEGYRGEVVREILKQLKDKGHKVVVWSNSFGYAYDCVKAHDLNVEYMSKQTRGDCDFDESQYFDIAFEDDRNQTWLAAKRFIWVNDVPDTIDEVSAFVSKLTQGI